MYQWLSKGEWRYIRRMTVLLVLFFFSFTRTWGQFNHSGHPKQQTYPLNNSYPFESDTIQTNQVHHISAERLRFSPQQLWAPAILIGTGVLTDLSNGLKNSQLDFYHHHLSPFHTKVDNWLLYVPALLPYGLDLIGIHSKTDVRNRTAILLKAEILVTASGFLLKHSIHERRPDGSNTYSFPSGHSLQVFATATLLSEEYKDQYKWMPYAAYGLATGVGLLRIANNKHYLGDVLVGAGLGILSMKMAYWTHQFKWHKHRHTH